MNPRAVCIFKVLSITKLENIFEALTDIGKSFHHSLSFRFYHLLCTEFRNTCTRIFILVLILFFTFIDPILETINDEVCLSFFSDEGDIYIFYKNEHDDIETFFFCL